VPAFTCWRRPASRPSTWLGVDGGTAYAQPFDEKDRLANGHRPFDVQFHAIASTAKLHGIKYRQLFPASAPLPA